MVTFIFGEWSKPTDLSQLLSFFVSTKCLASKTQCRWVYCKPTMHFVCVPYYTASQFSSHFYFDIQHRIRDMSPFPNVGSSCRRVPALPLFLPQMWSTSHLGQTQEPHDSLHWTCASKEWWCYISSHVYSKYCIMHMYKITEYRIISVPLLQNHEHHDLMPADYCVTTFQVYIQLLLSLSLLCV